MELSKKALDSLMSELPYVRPYPDTPVYVKRGGDGATFYTIAATKGDWVSAGSLYDIIQAGIEVLNS